MCRGVGIRNRETGTDYECFVLVFGWIRSIRFIARYRGGWLRTGESVGVRGRACSQSDGLVHTRLWFVGVLAGVGGDYDAWVGRARGSRRCLPSFPWCVPSMMDESAVAIGNCRVVWWVAGWISGWTAFLYSAGTGIGWVWRPSTVTLVTAAGCRSSRSSDSCWSRVARTGTGCRH